MSVGFGVIGTGMMGRVYARALRHMVEDADVVALHGASRDAELASEVYVQIETKLE